MQRLGIPFRICFALSPDLLLLVLRGNVIAEDVWLTLGLLFFKESNKFHSFISVNARSVQRLKLRQKYLSSKHLCKRSQAGADQERSD